jgi:hypothetical protein
MFGVKSWKELSTVRIPLHKNIAGQFAKSWGPVSANL